MNLRKYTYFILMCMLIMSLMLLPHHIREFLYFDINKFYNGEYWRFITGHIIHYSWLHCCLNFVGLVLIAALFNENIKTSEWFIATLVITILISLGLIITSQMLTWYVGFSGVLTGLYSYAAVKTIEDNLKISVIILLFLCVYVGVQLWGGELIRSALIPDMQTSTYAHALGLIAGIVCAITSRVAIALR